MKRFVSLYLITIFFASTQLLYATNFEIVPASTKTSEELGNTVDCVAGATGCGKDIKGKTVRDRYNNVSKNEKTSLGDQFAT